jgi:1-acyl-sn-glycerol-3-phosphate acyltransferase
LEHDAQTIRDRVNRLGIRFNTYGIDRFGVSRDHVVRAFRLLHFMYRRYFRCSTVGVQHVPDTGAALLVGNHSGGLPIDASLITAALFFDKDPPRYAHAMVEYFAQKWPFISPFFSRLGQLTGLPEHALRLLEDGRLVMAFPEGARGTGKLYRDRYQMVRFGTGFCRMAMRAKVPIIPFGFVGGEEAIPTMLHLKRLAKLIRAPYVPIPRQILPIPLPVSTQLYFGEPIHLEGIGDEPDEIIADHVALVRGQIEGLLTHGLSERPSAFTFSKIECTEADA